MSAASPSDLASASDAKSDIHRAVYPPSTCQQDPVTKPARSEHIQTTASAISSGLPIRAIGTRAISASPRRRTVSPGSPPRPPGPRPTRPPPPPAPRPLGRGRLDIAGAAGVAPVVLRRVVDRRRFGHPAHGVFAGEIARSPAAADQAE